MSVRHAMIASALLGCLQAACVTARAADTWLTRNQIVGECIEQRAMTESALAFRLRHHGAVDDAQTRAQVVTDITGTRYDDHALRAAGIAAYAAVAARAGSGLDDAALRARLAGGKAAIGACYQRLTGQAPQMEVVDGVGRYDLGSYQTIVAW